MGVVKLLKVGERKRNSKKSNAKNGGNEKLLKLGPSTLRFQDVLLTAA